ncbi:MAG: DUF2877 domain-containing protein [Anaerolineales bacterium]|nr:DUF2877 domain-containing protein [Anaerolineales bacterium]
MSTTPVIALSLTNYARTWLQTAQHVRVLHRFEHVHNLIDNNGWVVSLVTPTIGNGPFHVVVPHLCDYQDVDPTYATLWNAQPDWHRASHIKKHLALLKSYLISHTPAPTSPFEQRVHYHLETTTHRVLEALHHPVLLQQAVQIVAGQGLGLTPAGDDWLVGCMIALYLEGYPEIALHIAQTARPATTPLSAAWVWMAGQGQVSEHWHHLLNAHSIQAIESANLAILNQGHSSGVDAMRGFIQTLDAL